MHFKEYVLYAVYPNTPKRYICSGDLLQVTTRASEEVKRELLDGGYTPRYLIEEKADR